MTMASATCSKPTGPHASRGSETLRATLCGATLPPAIPRVTWGNRVERLDYPAPITCIEARKEGCRAAVPVVRRRGHNHPAGAVHSAVPAATSLQRGFTSTFTKFWLVGARGKMSGPNSPPIGGLGEASWAFEVMLVVVPAVVVPSIVPDAVGDV